MAVVEYTPRRSGFELRLKSDGGSEVGLHCADANSEPAVEGSAELRENLALMATLLAHGQNELAYRRARSIEKRKSHMEASRRYSRDAAALADMVERLGSDQSDAWCSGCFERTTHRHVRGQARPKAKYLCGNCGTPTVECAVPACKNHSVVGPRARVTLCYCAPHHHEIPSFEKLVVTGSGPS